MLHQKVLNIAGECAEEQIADPTRVPQERVPVIIDERAGAVDLLLVPISSAPLYRDKSSQDSTVRPRSRSHQTVSNVKESFRRITLTRCTAFVGSR